MAEIRHYRATDRDALYDICVRTADAGGDARGKYANDDLMGDLFAGPYAYLEPDLAFVVDDGGRAVGYIVGTSDTAEFAERKAAEWTPLIGDKYPVRPWPPRPDASHEDVMFGLHRHPEAMIVPALADYPAHLHIDLLPSHQGGGWGRKLIDTFVRAVTEAGAPGLHLGMVTANVRARGFYDRLGFAVLDVPDAGELTYLGMRLG